MADISGPLQIYPVSTTSYKQYGVYNFVSNSYGAGNYYHFKTSIALSTYVMTMVEAVGINYAASKPIKCLIGGTQTLYDGVSAHGVYLSSDNYFCLRAYVATPGDVSFQLSCVQANPSAPGYGLTITAAVHNNNSGNHY
jgi:hypothetical protein